MFDRMKLFLHLFSMADGVVDHEIWQGNLIRLNGGS